MKPFLLAFILFLQTTTGGVTNTGGSTTRGSKSTASVPAYSGVHCINQVSSGNVSCTPGTNPSAGQTIIISSGQINSGQTATLTDTNGTPVLCTGYPQSTFGGGAGTNSYIWYETNVTAGVHVFNATWGAGAGFPNIMVVGATSGTTVTCDSSLYATSSGTTFTGATFAAGGAGLLVSFSAPNAAGTITPGGSGAPLTLVDNNGANPGSGYSAIATSGSYFTSWSFTGGANYYVQEAFVQ